MTDEGKPMRLFFGVRVSLATVRALEDQVAELRAHPAADGAAARWVAPATYHVTLKYLGWTRPEVVAALRDRVPVAMKGLRRFTVQCEGLGCFPKPDKARVLWAGVDPEGGRRLTELATRLEQLSTDLGFASETRGFHPHVTLARLRRPGPVADLLAAASEQVYRDSRIDQLILFESQTKPDGSEYRPVATWPLEDRS